jgi:hypothetical protein
MHALGPRVAVVGNGPLTHADRDAIARAPVVVRFNDVKNWVAGEHTTLRVVRWPSAHGASACAAPVWYVTHDAASLPAQSNYTQVYERAQAHNDLDPTRADVRVFAHCNCGAACDENRTAYGPSTGAVVLSALQASPRVARIDVFGMNWNGPTYHIDFLNKTLVPRCCTKCVLHPTAGAAYGATWPTWPWAALAALVTLACTVWRRRCMRARALQLPP